MPKPERRPSGRGPRGRTGNRGPKGDPGQWPAAAFDLVMDRIEGLQEQLDDIKARLAELEEATPHRQTQRLKRG